MSQKISIDLQPLNRKVTVEKGTPLVDVLHEYGVEFPCGGKGTCGKCRIRILDGSLEMNEEQGQKLKKLNLDDSWRLACYCMAESDVILEVSQFEEIILAGDSSFEIIPRNGFGIAVDVGTTTLVAQLLDLSTGHLLDSETLLNPQVKYGADVITRIESCLQGKQNLLTGIIRSAIGNMIAKIQQRHPVPIRDVVLVGNTPMHHIFSGIDVSPLSFYPFESLHYGSRSFMPDDLGWPLPADASISFYPSIGSFVGSDILAGIAATGMAERMEYTLLADLGTNGEIVIGNREQILCASTAAGPAFEGARISQGMRAVTGAISAFYYETGKINHHVIGNVKPRGICGSGLIDAIAVLLQQERIGIFGELENDLQKIEMTTGIWLTQQDIREYQLAKAAVSAGIQILMNKLNLVASDIDKVFLAGGFGNFANPANVVYTGLLEVNEDQIVKMGNAALTGAKMFLFRNEQFIQEIIQKTRHVNLEADSSFQDIFTDKLMFVG